MQDARAVDGGDVELDVVDLHAVADLRRAPELAEDDAADGVVVVVRQVALEALVELLDRQAALDPVEVGPEAHDRRVLGIEFVVDLADDLLEQVLQRDEARDRAVLVDDDRHVALQAADLGQQLAQALRLGHQVRRVQQRAQIGAGPGSVLQGHEQPPHVQHAEHVVELVAEDRIARVRVLQHLLHRRRGREFHRQGDDVGPRHHDVLDGRVGEVEDLVDHLLLVALEHARALTLAQQHAQLDLAVRGLELVRRRDARARA